MNYHPAVLPCFPIIPWIALAMITSSARAESDSSGILVVDWSEQVAGAEPPKELTKHASITRWEREGKIEMLVVDANTEPRSPFLDGRPALMIREVEGEGAFGGLSFKPFVNPPLQGRIEFEAVLDDSRGLIISAWNESESLNPSDLRGRQLFSCSLPPNRKGSLRTSGGIRFGSAEDGDQYLAVPENVPPGVPTRFAVIWDFQSQPPTIGILVYGEWGGNPHDKALEIEVNPDVATAGIDAFSIRGIGFIGNIRVSAGE
jgi:hypothetical protein